MRNKKELSLKITENYKFALIYCRVSSERQKNEGSGLESQEHRCRAYANERGYEVEAVYKDSFTGGGDFLKRPAMSKLLAYVDNNPHKNYVVIFDDLKRFARDREFHFKLRTALKVRNVKPECLNYNFDDSPEGVFVETIFAAQGQLEKDQNKRQVVQKMKARLERGYWPFFPITGYISVMDPIHGKYPEAKIIREALEGFASNRFQDQMDVCRFLKSQSFFGKKTQYNLSTTRRLLERVEYTGYIEYPAWDVPRTKGHHEALISEGCYAKIQNKLNGKVMLRNRKDIDEDFPLRGFVLCPGCDREYTSSWCSGRNDKYPYYRCVQIGCPLKNASIPKERIENAVKAIFQQIVPKQELLDYVKTRLVMKWKEAQSRINDNRKAVDRSVAQIEARIKAIVSMIDGNKSKAVIEAYEKQIEELGQEELLAKERISQISDTRINFETALASVMEVLENPYMYWENGNLKRRRLLLQMVFSQKLTYSKSSGFETATLQLPTKVFERFNGSKCQGVEMLGIEPRCNRGEPDGSTAIVDFDV